MADKQHYKYSYIQNLNGFVWIPFHIIIFKYIAEKKPLEKFNGV